MLPFSAVHDQLPTLITRLAPVTNLGVAVQGLPDDRAIVGYPAGDCVVLAWIAWSPVQGAGNAVLGLVTQTVTLNCRVATRRLETQIAVADLIYQRLSGWELPTLPGHVLVYGGAEIVPPSDNDPGYRLDIRYGLVLQSRPLGGLA